jgi:23S rRNA pseudouridine2457 synthase
MGQIRLAPGAGTRLAARNNLLQGRGRRKSSHVLPHAPGRCRHRPRPGWLPLEPVVPQPALAPAAPVLIAFYKPYGVVSRFTSDGSPNRTLAEFGFPAGVYPLGRLDADSEGLLLLSDEPSWNQRLLHPRHAHTREYWAQVERIPSDESLRRLERGVVIAGNQSRPCRTWRLDPPPLLPPREPPVRFRKTVPDCWIALELVEGKNRQVRRMTAAVGHPTLRLMRVRIGRLFLGDLDLAPGRWKILSEPERRLVSQAEHNR